MNPVKLYTVWDNSFRKKGFPWINAIREGLKFNPPCAKCRFEFRFAQGDVEAELEPTKGSQWPDVLGCGEGGLFIVSKQTVDAWQRERVVENLPINRVKIVGNLPNKLRDKESKDYFWLDHKSLVGAQFDLERSGYVGVQRCDVCGSFRYDVSATYDRQHSPEGSPYVIVEGSWNGSKLFSVGPGGGALFCTEELIRIAHDYKLLNFRFVPIEEGIGAGHSGVEYLK